MARQKWNEIGRVWDDDHGLLDEAQVGECARADAAALERTPIPTRMVSNGEYMPIPQTDQQKQVEARLEELSTAASRKLGVSRRQFLASSGGMAAALLAINEVFGRVFDVSPIEMFEPTAFAQASVPRDVFIFDDQLHLVRGSRPPPLALRAVAQEPSRPPPSPPTRTTRPGSSTSAAAPGASGSPSWSACRSTRATRTSRSSSRTSISTARSPSACSATSPRRSCRSAHSPVRRATSRRRWTRRS